MSLHILGPVRPTTRLIVPLPCTVLDLATGQLLGYSDALSMLAADAAAVRVARSYPGAPVLIAGWTVFHRTSAAYEFRGDPLVQTEKECRQTACVRYGRKALDDNDELYLFRSSHQF
jgi:hypothetical protein